MPRLVASLVIWLALLPEAGAADWSEPWDALVLYREDGHPVVETPTGMVIPVRLAGIAAPPLLSLFTAHATAQNPDTLEPELLLDSEMLRLAVDRFVPNGSRLTCRDNGDLDFGLHVVACRDLLGRDIGALLVAAGVVWACSGWLDELPPDLDYAAVAAASPFRPLGEAPEGCEPL